MAEINDAYEALRRESLQGTTNGTAASEPSATEAPSRRGGPPRPRPTRPVTGRVDTSHTFRARNSTTTRHTPAAHRPPPPNRRSEREPLRASDPTGPLERGRIHRFRSPKPPSLDVAWSHELDFGKFRGHTLGQVADFEPSYIDWLANTITRDRELVASARVIQSELDRRGIRRRVRPQTTPAGRSA